MTPAEFWGSIRASGLTAEQELVELWERMRDCKPKIINNGPPIRGRFGPRRIPVPLGLREQQLEEDDLIIAFLTGVLQAGLLNH